MIIVLQSLLLEQVSNFQLFAVFSALKSDYPFLIKIVKYMYSFSPINFNRRSGNIFTFVHQAFHK